MKYSKVSSYMRPVCRVPLNCFGFKIRLPRFGFIFKFLLYLTFILICFIILLTTGITVYYTIKLINFILYFLCAVRYHYNDEYTWIKYGYSDQINSHSSAFSMKGKRPGQEDRYISNYTEFSWR